MDNNRRFQAQPIPRSYNLITGAESTGGNNNNPPNSNYPNFNASPSTYQRPIRAQRNEESKGEPVFLAPLSPSQNPLTRNNVDELEAAENRLRESRANFLSMPANQGGPADEFSSPTSPPRLSNAAAVRRSRDYNTDDLTALRASRVYSPQPPAKYYSNPNQVAINVNVEQMVNVVYELRSALQNEVEARKHMETELRELRGQSFTSTEEYKQQQNKWLAVLGRVKELEVSRDMDSKLLQYNEVNSQYNNKLDTVKVNSILTDFKARLDQQDKIQRDEINKLRGDNQNLINTIRDLDVDMRNSIQNQLKLHEEKVELKLIQADAKQNADKINTEMLERLRDQMQKLETDNEVMHGTVVNMRLLTDKGEITQKDWVQSYIRESLSSHTNQVDNRITDCTNSLRTLQQSQNEAELRQNQFENDLHSRVEGKLDNLSKSLTKVIKHNYTTQGDTLKSSILAMEKRINECNESTGAAYQTLHNSVQLLQSNQHSNSNTLQDINAVTSQLQQRALLVDEKQNNLENVIKTEIKTRIKQVKNSEIKVEQELKQFQHKLHTELGTQFKPKLDELASRLEAVVSDVKSQFQQLSDRLGHITTELNQKTGSNSNKMESFTQEIKLTLNLLQNQFIQLQNENKGQLSALQQLQAQISQIQSDVKLKIDPIQAEFQQKLQAMQADLGQKLDLVAHKAANQQLIMSTEFKSQLSELSSKHSNSAVENSKQLSYNLTELTHRFEQNTKENHKTIEELRSEVTQLTAGQASTLNDIKTAHSILHEYINQQVSQSKESTDTLVRQQIEGLRSDDSIKSSVHSLGNQLQTELRALEAAVEANSSRLQAIEEDSRGSRVALQDGEAKSQAKSAPVDNVPAQMAVLEAKLNARIEKIKLVIGETVALIQDVSSSNNSAISALRNKVEVGAVLDSMVDYIDGQESGGGMKGALLHQLNSNLRLLDERLIHVEASNDNRSNIINGLLQVLQEQKSKLMGIASNLDDNNQWINTHSADIKALNELINTLAHNQHLTEQQTRFVTEQLIDNRSNQLNNEENTRAMKKVILDVAIHTKDAIEEINIHQENQQILLKNHELLLEELDQTAEEHHSHLTNLHVQLAENREQINAISIINPSVTNATAAIKANIASAAPSSASDSAAAVNRLDSRVDKVESDLKKFNRSRVEEAKQMEDVVEQITKLTKKFKDDNDHVNQKIATINEKLNHPNANVMTDSKHSGDQEKHKPEPIKPADSNKSASNVGNSYEPPVDKSLDRSLSGSMKKSPAARSGIPKMQGKTNSSASRGSKSLSKTDSTGEPASPSNTKIPQFKSS
jgi:hypothetical protein